MNHTKNTLSTLIFFVLLGLISNTSYAQEDYDIEYKKRVKKGALVFRTHPGANIVGRFEYSLEKFVTDNKSIVIDHGITVLDDREYYYDEFNNQVFNGQAVFGSNIGINMRKYFNNDDEILSSTRVLFYGEFGAKYFFYNRTFQDYEQTWYVDSANCYYDFFTNTYTCPSYSIQSRVTKKQKTHKFGADIGIGMSIVISEVFFVDFNLGGGMRYSISTPESNSQYYYGLNTIDYTGITPQGHLKLGILLR